MYQDKNALITLVVDLINLIQMLELKILISKADVTSLSLYHIYKCIHKVKA